MQVGPAVHSAKRACDHERGLGLLHVELLEPWCEAAFLAKMPPSAEFVAVSPTPRPPVAIDLLLLLRGGCFSAAVRLDLLFVPCPRNSPG